MDWSHLLRSAGEALSERWHMRQQFKSPSYTTRWAEVLTLHL